jgi:hypothetical protein
MQTHARRLAGIEAGGNPCLNHHEATNNRFTILNGQWPKIAAALSGMNRSRAIVHMGGNCRDEL